MNKSNGWTQERRAQQAARIRQQKPWLQSTGPKTVEGKAKVARNAYKGGAWKAMQELRRRLNEGFEEQQRFLNGL